MALFALISVIQLPSINQEIEKRLWIFGFRPWFYTLPCWVFLCGRNSVNGVCVELLCIFIFFSLNKSVQACSIHKFISNVVWPFFSIPCVRCLNSKTIYPRGHLLYFLWHVIKKCSPRAHRSASLSTAVISQRRYTKTQKEFIRQACRRQTGMKGFYPLHKTSPLVPHSFRRKFRANAFFPFFAESTLFFSPFLSAEWRSP